MDLISTIEDDDEISGQESDESDHNVSLRVFYYVHSLTRGYYLVNIQYVHDVPINVITLGVWGNTGDSPILELKSYPHYVPTS